MTTLLILRRINKLLAKKLVINIENLSLIACGCDGSIQDVLYENEARIEEIDRMIKEIKLLIYN